MPRVYVVLRGDVRFWPIADISTHPAFLPSERGSMIPAPRCGARNPPSHVRAVALVLLGKLLAERRLLVAEHEQKEGRPHDRSVLQHRYAAEQEALTDDQRGDRDVHRIAHIPIDPGDNEVLGRHHGSRRTETLQREPGE